MPHPPTSAATSAVHRNSIRLDRGAIASANPKWIQVCRTGSFKGYKTPKGLQEFAIDDATADAMIANLRRHPCYVAGVAVLAPEAVAAGVVETGELGVVPFDIEHGHGPAEAWGLELERRPSTEGGSTLWMLTYFLEPAASWVREARFKSTSIEWEEDGTDPVSGQRVGPQIIRVALTNDPFVQGMQAMQGARALQTLLLSLQAQPDRASMLTEIDRLLGEMAEPEDTPMADAPANTTLAATPLLMSGPPEIVMHFSRALRVEATEPAVTVALTQRLSRADDAFAAMEVLMKATGASSPADLVSKVTALAELKVKMDEILPQMEEMETAGEMEAESMVASDVGAVMQSRGYGPELEDALSFQRRGASADYFAKLPAKERKAKREEARKAFQAKYPIPDGALQLAQLRALGGTMFTGTAPKFPPLGSHQGSGRTPPAQDHHKPPPPPGAPTWAAVNAFAGGNDAVRVRNFVRSQNPNLSTDDAWALAARLRNDLIQREGPSPI